MTSTSDASVYAPEAATRRAVVAWSAYALVAGVIAAGAIGRWLWAVSFAGPVLYGEGAVAHAAILARDRLEYTASAFFGEAAPIFTAANYPPLYFHLAGLGDPFVVGRAISIAATLAVAGLIAWRARGAGALVAAALAAGWLATFPVAVWGAAVKPDLVALALTAFGVVALGVERPLLAGLLLGAAVTAKPTAGLPALALLVPLVARGQARGVLPYVAGGIAALLAVAALTHGPDRAMYLHVIDWNQLAWHPDQALLLVIVAIVTLGVPALVSVASRPPGAVAAYLAGAAAIVILGGREGATINYLLDLATASALALATLATRIRPGVVLPLAAAAQLVAALVILDPFGVVPGRPPSTGAWSDPARLGVVRALPNEPALVEDAGLLVAAGREPLVDDLFLWSRLYERGGSFLEGERLLGAVRERRLARVVSEADLEGIDSAPAYERQRWAAALVRAVLDGYRFERRESGLWVYVRR